MRLLLPSKAKGYSFHSEGLLAASSAWLLCLLLVFQAPACIAQQLSNVSVVAAEYSITAAFVPSPAATNYTVSFRLKLGFVVTDFPFEPPYNSSELSQTYTDVLPGHEYRVEIYENTTSPIDRVFEQDITTVPLMPERVSVMSQGNDFLFLQWVSSNNFTYDKHEITYIRDNGSLRVVETPFSLTYNLTGLEAGYSYDIYVVAVSNDVRSRRSQKVKAATIPLAPLNVTASAVGTDNINITWLPDPASYQESYIVNYTVSESSIELGTECIDTPCVFSPRSLPGETISIFVYAESHSFNSLPAIIQHSTEPGKVIGLRAEEAVRSLLLKWIAPVDSYQEYYWITVTSLVDQGVQEFKVEADLTSFLLDSLKGGYMYHVQVQALSEFELGDGEDGIFRTLPEPVANLAGSAVNTSSIQFTWSNPAFSEVDGLNITVFTEEGDIELKVKEDDVTITSYTVGGLLPGTSYTVNITVLSKYSDPSAEASTLIRTKPVPPTIIDVISEETVLYLKLVPSADVGVFDTLQAQLEGGVVQHIADTDGLVTFTDLEPGTTYTIETFSVSGEVHSDKIITTLNTRPRPIRDLFVLSLGEQNISAEWTAPDRGGFDNFTVLVSDVDGITNPLVREFNTAELETILEDLQPGTTYNVSVMAVKGNQRSDALWDVNTTTPLPVTHVRVAVRGIDTVTLAWDAPAASALSGFALTFNPLNLTFTLLPVEVDQYKLEGLEPDTNYTAQVYTYSQGPGEDLLYSSAVSFNFSTYPESVAALQKVEALTDSITVNWTAPTSVNIDFFQLGIKAANSAAPPKASNVAQNITFMTFEGLEPGQEYTIAIRTGKFISGGMARYGVSVRLQAVTKPLPVQELQADTINTTAVALTWQSSGSSQQNRFRITYTADEISRSLTVPSSVESGGIYQMDIGQLLPGYNYSFAVVVVRSIETDLAESEENFIPGYTVPSPVRNLTLDHENTDLLIAWSPPASGRWKSYKVMYRSVLRDNKTEYLLRTADQSDNRMRITELFPGEMYEVQVMCTSHNLDSELREATTVFDPLPPMSFDHIADQTTTEGLTLTWGYDVRATFTEQWSVRISAGSASEVKFVEANRDQQEYELNMTRLEPGQTYTVNIIAQVMEKSSEAKTIEVTTKPIIRSELTPNPSTNSSVSLSYSIMEDDIFDHLLFTLHDDLAPDPTVMKTKDDRKRSIMFEGLEAGTKYRVQVATISKGEKSESKSLDLITDPNPVPVAFTASSTSIRLTLGPQLGQAAQYVVSCSESEASGIASKGCDQREVVADGNSKEVTFDELRPYQTYSFTVVTRAEMLRGSQKQVSRAYDYITDEAAPSVVRSLTVQAQGIHSVIVTWQPPEMANGRLRSYTLAYMGSDPADPEQSDRDMKIEPNIPITESSWTLNDLRAGFSYTFSIYAVTVAKGETAKQVLTLGTSAPAFRPGLSAIKAKPELLDSSTGGVSAATETKISLTFTNPFSSENGNIRYYTVIVSTDVSAPSSDATLPSWADAQADSSIKVYQALDRCEDFFSSSSSCGRGGSSQRRRRAVNTLDSRTFIIGEETDCGGKAFCNGPLASNTEYYVKLRGFTASGEYEETAYSEKIRTAKKSSSNSALGAGIGTTVSVLAGVGVVMAVIIVRRRRRPKRATKHVGPKTTWEQSTMCKFSRPVKLSDYPTHVRKMAADSDFKYAEEYEDLKEVGKEQPCMAAEFPPNRPKNRFTNILPYDHSRVKLLPTDDDEGSDYINANYMPGFNSKREYIATQGPLPATRDDFWRMLWEQSCRNIVMLTRCQEKGREKSDHYWPTDSDPKFYGDLHVVVLNETHMPDWTVTEIRVSLGEQSRTVRHFHYQVWPDFGVPKDRTSLIRFVRMVREKLVREGGPIITHCSAGVGRSGTFIVLDHLLQMIREKDEVDIFSIVYKLRKERVLMVQTELQYKFIHECLLCVLEGKEDDTTYANVGQVNVGFDDDEGINVMEVP